MSTPDNKDKLTFTFTPYNPQTNPRDTWVNGKVGQKTDSQKVSPENLVTTSAASEEPEPYNTDTPNDGNNGMDSSSSG